jgi:hypothetical protein
MAIQAQPEAPTASPAPREQSLSNFLHVEIMNDLDNGRPTLVTATETNLGDLRETSPARALGMVADARAQLDRIERLIKVHEARDTLAAILAERHARLEEWDTDNAGDLLRDRFGASAYFEKRQMVVVVPLGQDPVERTYFVAMAVNRLAEQKARA